MNRCALVLCLAFANSLLLGQTAPGRTSPADQLEGFQKRFPPEVIAPYGVQPTAVPARHFCVQPSPDHKSLSVKPCRTDVPKILFLKPVAQPVKDQ